MKKADYNNDLQGKNNEITFLPNERIVLDEAISETKTLIKELQKIDELQKINIKYYRTSIAYLDKLDYIGEIILFCVNQVAALKESEERQEKEKLIEKMMEKVFWKFEYSEYSNHKLFRNYKIQKTEDPKKFLYKIETLNPFYKKNCSYRRKSRGIN